MYTFSRFVMTLGNRLSNCDLLNFVLLAVTILIASVIGHLQFYTPLKIQNLNSLYEFVDE